MNYVCGMMATQLLSILQRDHGLQSICPHAILHGLWILIGLCMMTYVAETTFQHFKTMMIGQLMNIHQDGISKKLIGMNLNLNINLK